MLQAVKKKISAAIVKKDSYMKQLAKALEETYDNSSAIGRMIQRTQGPKKRLLPNVRKRKPKNKTTLTYEQGVMFSLKNGWGAMRPANLIGLRPGANVMAHGRQAVLKWSLITPGSKEFVAVVLFNEPQDIKGQHGVKSRWAMVESEFVEKIKW